jgi:hypothetical protein
MVGFAAAAAAALGGWWLVNSVDPVPSALAGMWQNETLLLAAGPGEVQLTIQRDGQAVVAFDRTCYEWWGATQFRLRVRGKELILHVDSPHPEGRSVAMQIEISGERFRVSAPASQRADRDELVFHRVRRP